MLDKFRFIGISECLVLLFLIYPGVVEAVDPANPLTAMN
jgi:hypothetical protein